MVRFGEAILCFELETVSGCDEAVCTWDSDLVMQSLDILLDGIDELGLVLLDSTTDLRAILEELLVNVIHRGLP